MVRFHFIEGTMSRMYNATFSINAVPFPFPAYFYVDPGESTVLSGRLQSNSDTSGA